MKIRLLSAIAITCVTLTGCSSQSGPNYSLFKNVPASRLAKVKSAIQHSGMKNVELPTKFPYPLTTANIPNNGEFPPQSFDIYLGDATHVLEIKMMPTSSNAPVNSSSMLLGDDRAVKLSDGTKALYGNNGAASLMAWNKNGVIYILVSSNDKNKPDLTESQLIGVANSFE